MKNRFGSRRRGRQLRYGVVVFAWLLSQHALAQLDDTFGVSPPMPFSSAPFTIQIHAYTGTSPSPIASAKCTPGWRSAAKFRRHDQYPA